jgi:hypothetical protein
MTTRRLTAHALSIAAQWFYIRHTPIFPTLSTLVSTNQSLRTRDKHSTLSVRPYLLLGPLALIKQLQLIVETPILLPDEVINLVESRGVDMSTLGSYDLAMLNILGCLWND